jgi:hypothetical protein
MKAYSGLSAAGHLSNEGLLIRYVAVLIVIPRKIRQVPVQWRSCSLQARRRTEAETGNGELALLPYLCAA